MEGLTEMNLKWVQKLSYTPHLSKKMITCQPLPTESSFGRLTVLKSTGEVRSFGVVQIVIQRGGGSVPKARS